MRFPAIALTLLLSACTSTPTTPAASPAAEVSPSASAAAAYTLAQYEAIENGMTLKEVEEQLGKGEEISSSEFNGVKTARYIWQNPDGSNMTITLQGDKVISKAQFGLK